MLIIDANCASAVFDAKNSRHSAYRPILIFLFKERGIIVTGGTKYLLELGKVGPALAAIKELARLGQVRVSNKEAVDNEELRICAMVPPPACDDQHIIALISISGARVLASDDKRADRFIKDRNLYPNKRRRPFIYRNSVHSKILRRLPRL